MGARTPGVDRATVSYIVDQVGVSTFLTRIRDLLKSGQFRLVEVRQVMGRAAVVKREAPSFAKT